MYTYAYYDQSGSPIYVGMAKDVLKRFKEHQRVDDWANEIASITVWGLYPGKTEATQAERNLIGSLRPKYNQMFSEYQAIENFGYAPLTHFASTDEFVNYYSNKPDTLDRRTHYFSNLDLEALRVIIYYTNTEASLLMRRYLAEGIQRDQERIGHPGIYEEAKRNLIRRKKVEDTSA